MPGLLFQDAAPAVSPSPNRADVACFVGFVARRRTPVPPAVTEWLQQAGWPNLPGTLLENEQLASTVVADDVRTELLAQGWPELSATGIQKLAIATDATSMATWSWLQSQGWPNLPSDLLANRQLDTTPVNATVRTWLLAQQWPELQLYVESDLQLLTAIPGDVAEWLTAQNWPALPAATRSDTNLEFTPVAAATKAWLLAHEWPQLAVTTTGSGFTLSETLPIEVKDWLLDQGWPDISQAAQNDLGLTATVVPPATKAWLLAHAAWPDPDIAPAGWDLSVNTPVSDDQKTWLQAWGWRAADVEVRDDDPLLHTPIAVESFDAFDRLFAWEARPENLTGAAPSTWIGATVRSFFSQGGARCFVVRTGNPWAYSPPDSTLDAIAQAAAAAEQSFRLELLLPGLHGGATPSPADRTSWLGLGVMLGLDEAAFVALPDLPELVADATNDRPSLPPPPPAPEMFEPYSPAVDLPADDVQQTPTLPSCTEAGYLDWFRAANAATALVRQFRRDVELILALPLPAAGTLVDGDILRFLDDTADESGLAAASDGESDGIASAFLQLAYPWVATTGSVNLPGGLESPDGVVIGVIARSVAQRGAYQSAGRQAAYGVQSFYPPLSAREFQLATAPQGRPALVYRVSLLAPTPDGPQLISDVTTSLEAAHRPASVGRLTAAILRTARELGDATTFAPSGPAVWRKLQGRLDRLLGNFYAAGALLGDSKQDAYSVVCDGTTTSQQDLDNGRVIAEVTFAPAYPVGLITVVLALRESGLSAQGGAA